MITLNKTQLIILQIIKDRVEKQEPKTLIQMPSGTGRLAVLTSFLIAFFNETEASCEVIFVVRNEQWRAQLLSYLKEYIESPTTKVIILLENELKSLEGYISLLDIKGIFMLDINFEKINEEFVISNKCDLIPIIAVTSEAEHYDFFGPANFLYSNAQAINDGCLVPVEYVYIEFDEKQFDYDIITDGVPLDNNPSVTAEIQLMYSSISFLEAVSKDILSRVGSEKSLIISRSIRDADVLCEIINRISGKQISFVIHSLQPDSSRYKLRLFREKTSFLNILIIVESVDAISSLNFIENIIALKHYNSTKRLKKLVEIGQRADGYKDKVRFLDYVGNLKKLESIFNEGSLIFFDHRNQIPIFPRSLISFNNHIETVFAADELAEELAEIIKIIPAAQGAMIGIFGKWGRGKTFLKDLIWNNLERTKEFTKIDFHTWKYQDTPATWAYLYECFAETYFNTGNNKRNRLRKIFNKGLKRFKLSRKRQGYLPFIKIIGFLAVSVMSFFLGNEYLVRELKLPKNVFFGAGIPAILTILTYAYSFVLKNDFSLKAKDIFLKYSSKHSYKDHLGLQAEIQKEMLKLLECWIPDVSHSKQRIVLFVEDIDRCNEIKVIQIIDSLRVLLENEEIAKRVVIVAAVDEHILKLAIKNKYSSLIAKEVGEPEYKTKLDKLCDEYMDKLFISGVKLGKLSEEDRDNFMLALTKQDRSNILEINSLAEIIENENDIRYYQKRESKVSEKAYEAAGEIAQENDILSYPENDRDKLQVEDEKVLEIEEKANSKIPKNKLTNEELNVLRLAIRLYDDATPRQIRVFYYRYLIAKNLLSRRYKSINRENYWSTPLQSRLLTKLIILYTVDEDTSLLQKHLDEALNCRSEKMDLHLLETENSNTYDYRELLKVLNIVIAY